MRNFMPRDLRRLLALMLAVLLCAAPVSAGITVTGADGITVTGADGITVTGADGINYIHTNGITVKLGSGAEMFAPRMQVETTAGMEPSMARAAIWR